MIKETSVYAGIVKMDDNPDGTLTVYGKATDDSLDIDQQICDAVWLDKAMPEWFTTGGNIREQHSNIAAGVAEEYERKQDGHYISALIVDPVSVKKVKSRVLKGFSIGIKSPRVVRDEKAANGRIIDGQIVEVSLVDRPANPNARLVLAKSASGTMVKTEEYVEKHGDHDQSEHGNWAHGGGGGGKDKPSKDKPSGGSDKPSGRSYEEMLSDPIEGERYRNDDKKVYDIASSVSNSRIDLDNLVDENSDKFIDNLSDNDENLLYEAQDSLEEANNALNAARDSKTDGQHLGRIDAAMVRIDEAASMLHNADNRTLNIIAGELDNHYDKLEAYYESFDNPNKSAAIRNRKEEPLMKERKSRVRKSTLRKETNGMPMGGQSNVMPSREEMTKRYADARKSLDEITRMCKECGYDDIIEKQYGETAEQETAEGPMVGSGVDAAGHELAETKAESTDGCDCDGCKMCKESGGCDSKMCKGHKADKELVAEDGEEELKSATRKCLECGCNMPADSHGNPNVSTAVMSTPDQMPVGGPVIQPPTPKSVETILQIGRAHV